MLKKTSVSPFKFKSFYWLKWQSSLPCHPWNTWSLKKVPLSRGASPYKPLYEVLAPFTPGAWAGNISVGSKHCPVMQSQLLFTAFTVWENQPCFTKVQGEHIIVYQVTTLLFRCSFYSVYPFYSFIIVIIMFIHFYLITIKIMTISRAETGRMYSFSK